VGPSNHVLDGVQMPQEERVNFGKLFSPLKSIAICFYVVSCKTINNGITVQLQLQTAILPTGRCHIKLSYVKNPTPMRCSLSSKFFDHLSVIFAAESGIVELMQGK